MKKCMEEQTPFGAPKGGAQKGGAQKGGSQKGGAQKGGAQKGGAQKGGAQKGGAHKGGAPKGGAPKGGAPKGGAQKGGGPRVGPGRVGGPKFRSLFFPLPPHFRSFLCLSGCLLVEFRWCLKRRGPEMCTFGVLGLSCEAPAGGGGSGVRWSGVGWSSGIQTNKNTNTARNGGRRPNPEKLGPEG